VSPAVHPPYPVSRIVHGAEPEAIEDWNGSGCPSGITTPTLAKVIFLMAQSLPDSGGPFDAELAGNTRQAIKFFEGDGINEGALSVSFVRYVLNSAKSKGKPSANRRRIGSSRNRNNPDRDQPASCGNVQCAVSATQL
jgi:hypothetical protein